MPFSSGPPEVKVESDEQNRGTPYRTCSVAVYLDELDNGQMNRIRTALSRVVSSPEISAIASGGGSRMAGGRFVRLRTVYYGNELASERIVDAVQSAL